jgi:hypothetical protein
MKIQKILIVLFVTLVFSACQEVIDWDLNEGNEHLVVNGEITTEYKKHYVYLSLTSDYYGNNPPEKVSGAKVQISDGTQVFPLTEEEPGVYATDSIAGQTGKIYELTIEYNGETYTAKDSLPEVTDMQAAYPIQLFDTIPFTDPPEIDSGWSVVMLAQEPPGKGNHYMWRYYVNGKLESDTLREWLFANDDFVDGNSPQSGWLLYTQPQKIRKNVIHKGDTFKLCMYSITKQYYDHLLSVLFQTDFRGGFFDGPPSNASTNLTNGAVGFFHASDVSCFETPVY